MAQQGAPVAGAQADWEDYGQDLPQYGDRFDGPLASRSWNPRSIPVAALASRTLWPRGEYPFEVSIPPPQFFNAEAPPEAH